MNDEQTAAILLRQDAVSKARERMLGAILSYEPCRVLTIGDAKFLADWASTVSYDAIKAVDEKEGRA